MNSPEDYGRDLERLADKYEERAVEEARRYSSAIFSGYMTEFTAIGAMFTIAAALRSIAGR